MSSVNQFVGHRKLKGFGGNIFEAELVVQSTDKNEPVRADF